MTLFIAIQNQSRIIVRAATSQILIMTLKMLKIKTDTKTLLIVYLSEN